MGLELVEFVMAVADEFAIKVLDADADLLSNLSLFTDYVVKAAAADGRRLDHLETLEKLKAILIEITGIDPSEIFDEADFTFDLGIDANIQIATKVHLKRWQRPLKDVL